MRIPGPRWECPPGVHVRLHGNLTLRVTADHGGRTLVLRGIRSARTLRTLSPAVASFGAFGRYDRVLLDLTHFRDGSPELTAALAADARRSAASGRSLDFVRRPPLTAPPVADDAPESEAHRGRRPGAAQPAGQHGSASSAPAPDQGPVTRRTGVRFDPASTLLP